MPELPEVETVKRGLAPIMEGARISRVEQRRPNLRFPFPDDFVARLEGVRINNLSRRAKYVLVELDNGATLIMHLGMSGSFHIEIGDDFTLPGKFHHDRNKKEAHDHVVFHLDTPHGEAKVIYNDPRRFGYMDLIGTAELHQHPFFAKLGIEPTGNQLSGEAIAAMFHGKATPLKSALLDQSLIAGLGNIYVCEALWRSRLSPKRKAGSIVTKTGKATVKANELAGHIRDIIVEAIEAGGSSLQDHRQTDGSLGYFQHSFAVYGREGELCNHEACGAKIARITQSGRSTFYCAKCQK